MNVCGRRIARWTVPKLCQTANFCKQQTSSEVDDVRDLCRRYAREKLQPIAAKLDADSRYPAENIEELGRLGWLAMNVSRSDGGSGLSTLALSVAVEELSAGCASTGAIISIHNCLYTSLLGRHASSAQKTQFLHPFIEQNWLGCFALSEAEAGSDVANIKTTATPHEDGFLLNGTKSWVTSGPVGRAAVVFATVDTALQHKGITAFLVPLPTEGVLLGRAEKKLGIRAAPCCSITLDNVYVPQANVLSAQGIGFKLAMAQLELARIGIASQALGIARAALDVAVDYSFNRIAFRRQINEFQAVKLRIAEMALRLDAARLLVHRAATTYDSHGRAAKETSMAKAAASEAANAIAHSAMQILGGMGYVQEMPAERHFRDARVTEIYGGVTDIQKLIIADCVLAEHKR